MYYIISDDRFFSYGLSEALKEKNEEVLLFTPRDVMAGKFPADVAGSVILVDTECCLTFQNIVLKLGNGKGKIIPVFDIAHITLINSWKYGYISKKETLNNIVSILNEFSFNRRYLSLTTDQEQVIRAQIHGVDNHHIASKLDKSLTSVYRLRTDAIKSSGLWPINSQGVRYLYQIVCRNHSQANTTRHA